MSHSRRRIAAALGAAALASIGLLTVAVGGGTAGAAAPSAAAARAGTGGDQANAADATLKIIEPSASIRKKGKDQFKPAEDGAKLHVGDTVQTDGTGFVEIDYTDDSFTRLDVNTTFTIISLTDDQGNRKIDGSLESGQAWNRTSALTESESFEQEGAGATAAVVGSAFLFDCDGQGHCIATSVVDGLKYTSVDGEVKFLDPLEACTADEKSSTNTDLCANPVDVPLDALNAFAALNVYLDGLLGLPVPIAGTIDTDTGVVTPVDIVVTTSTPTPPAPPAIDAAPVNVQDPGGDPAPSAAAGPGSAVVSQDERSDVTFVLQVTNLAGGSYWIVFTDLPTPAFGRLLTAGLAVGTGTQYLPGTVFTFDPVEMEPVCTSEPETLADCFTNGVAETQFDPNDPAQTGGAQSYPSPVVDNGNGTVSWFDSFSFVAQNDQGGQSAEVTVPLEAVDDICNTNDEGPREANSVVEGCASAG